MRKCVLSFATTERNFEAGIHRISGRLNELDFDGDYLYWIVSHRDFPEGCPTHLESPWGFKPWCFQQALSRGYDLALWLDTSVVPVNIDLIFKKIAEKGSYFVRAKHQTQINRMAGEACSDHALEAMGLKREQALTIPQISAARIGLNLHNDKSLKFLAAWQHRSMDGVSFKGYRGCPTPIAYSSVYSNEDEFASSDSRVIGHRHDQTIASILVNDLNIAWEPENDNEAFFNRTLVKRQPRAGFKKLSRLLRLRRTIAGRQPRQGNLIDLINNP